jgi:hypothetical protein
MLVARKEAGGGGALLDGDDDDDTSDPHAGVGGDGGELACRARALQAERRGKIERAGAAVAAVSGAD